MGENEHNSDITLANSRHSGAALLLHAESILKQVYQTLETLQRLSRQLERSLQTEPPLAGLVLNRSLPKDFCQSQTRLFTLLRQGRELVARELGLCPQAQIKHTAAPTTHFLDIRPVLVPFSVRYMTDLAHRVRQIQDTHPPSLQYFQDVVLPDEMSYIAHLLLRCQTLIS
jgi:hypothetical protein